jgi:hypothetical protein
MTASEINSSETLKPSRVLLQLITVPVIVIVAYGLIDHFKGGDALLAAVEPGTRQTFFASLAATCGALLGFAITGLTILLTLGGGKRMQWLLGQKVFRTQARALFTTAIGALGLATAIFLLLILVATDKDSFWAPWGYVAFATMALVAERLARLILFFHDLMGIALEDGDGEPQGVKPPFTEPMDD